MAVRSLYQEGKGTPALACVEQGYGGKALEFALAYLKAVGYTGAGVIQSTFKEETEKDLFGHNAEHPLEEVGKRIRAMMPWLDPQK